jgi:hypothetical protein
MKYVDFNDSNLPIGKRKVAYVKWAISKGTDRLSAMSQANRKFGFEQKGKKVVVVHSFGGESRFVHYSKKDILLELGVNPEKFEDCVLVIGHPEEERVIGLVNEYKSRGYSVENHTWLW